MKRVLLVLLLFVFFGCGNAYADGFTLTSRDISGQLSGDQVFSGFGCTGGNLSPQLSWGNAPEGTKSFAITVYDKDAPTGSGFWHWVIFNIPADVKTIKRDAGNLNGKLAPAGSVQSTTDFGTAGFGGACPPEGAPPHSYVFTVYALGVEKLDLAPETPAAMAGFLIHQNTLAKASLVAYYSR